MTMIIITIIILLTVVTTTPTNGFRILPTPTRLMIPTTSTGMRRTPPPPNPAATCTSGSNLRQQQEDGTSSSRTGGSRLFLFRNNDNNKENNNKQYGSSIMKSTTTTTQRAAISDGSPIPYFPNENNDDDNNIDVNSTSSSSFYFSATKDKNNSNNEIGGSSTKSLREIIDDLGRAVKVKAIEATKQAKSIDVNNAASNTINNNAGTIKSTKLKKYFYIFQSCILYTLFIIYRGYRGFFVILPAVFRETFRKLESSIEPAPFDEDNTTTTGSSNSSSNNAVSDIPRNDTIISWRVRIIVSILSSIVVTTYVLSGLARVVIKMVQTLRTNKDPLETFAAAADEQELNEKKLYNKIINKK